MLPDIRPGNTKILYFFNCLLDGMHTKPSAPARVQVRAKALKGKKVKVSLKKTAEAKGYEIVYSTNVNFTKKTTKKISTKNLTKTIKKLKKKKTYYIKARAYKLDGKTKVYGRWSLIRKVTIKK